MKIYCTMAPISGDPELETKIHQIDTIEYEGGLWLVPEWLEAPTEGWKKPARIVRMDSLPHSPMPDTYPADFLLNGPIPKAVLDGQIPRGKEALYDVIEGPDIKFDIPSGIH
jgi:hypothetical protein